MTATLEEHHVPGQLNIYVLDKDSEVTGRGQHNRIRVGLDVETRLLEADEDCGTGPRLATLDEIRKVINHPNHKVHSGRAIYTGSERWTSPRMGRDVWTHTFRIERA